ncbi:TniB family NTP-binding protein [Pseudomonas sp. LS2P72]
MEQYEHIVEAKRHLASLPNANRIAICRHDFWINTPRLAPLFKCIENMLYTEDQLQASCIIVYGKGGYGKSAIVQRLIDLNIISPYKLKFVTMTENLDRYRLHQSVCIAFGVESTGKSTPKTAAVFRVIKAENVTGLLIDEIHDAMSQAYGQKRATLSLMKNMAGDPLMLCLIVFGNHTAAQVLAVDDQLNRRFVQWELTPWKNDQDFTDFVHAYESHLPLRLPSGLAQKRLRDLLFKYSHGIMDNVVKIMKAFAMDAIETGAERIHNKQFPHVMDITKKFGYQLTLPSTSVGKDKGK